MPQLNSLTRYSLVLLVAVTLVGCAGAGGAGSAVWPEWDAASLGTPVPPRTESTPGGFTGSTVSRSECPPVYFSFDAYTLPRGEAPNLTSAATTLKNSSYRLIIAGFT